MSKEAKKIIEEKISKNKTICDLSTIESNRENLSYILEKLEQSSNIGYIKLNENINNNDEIKDLKDKIEKKLIKNNQNYRSFPNDHIHCLLSLHCNETDFKNYKESDSLFDKEAFKLLKKQEWKVKEVFQERGYKSVIYINKQTKHIVLAFQGFKLEIRDFFLQDSLIGSTVYSMIANKDIAPQTIYSYIHTQSAVDFCKKGGDKKEVNYSLSFTGHGFGAWLAEQAIYFSIKEFSFDGFGFDNVKAVTFDSPGSYNYLEILNNTNIISNETKFELTDLNIVTYLSAPNFMNTCNKHVGKVFRIFTHTDHIIDTNNIVYSLIDSISAETFRNKIKKCYKEKVESSLNKYTFILNGFITLFHDSLNLILNEFDSNTGKPIKYKKMMDWPKFEFTPSNNFKENLNTLFDFKHVIESIPDFGLVPDKAKTIITKGVNFLVNKAVEFVSQNLLNGITVIINFMIEIVKGNLNMDQFQYNDSVDKYNKREITVCNQDCFNLKFLGHYRIIEVNLNQDILLKNNEGSIDQFLYNLYYYVKDVNDLKDLKDNFLKIQLFQLKKLYQVSSSLNKPEINSTETEVELIRYRLDRLLKVNKNLKKFLHELIGLKRSNEDSIYLGNEEGDSLDSYFIGRSEELKKIEEAFKTKQYVYIQGRSGFGKSQLALKYSINAKQNKYIIKWIKSKEIYQSFIELADELKINIIDRPKFDELAKIIKKKLNKFTNEKKLNLMFFIDNLVYESKDESLNEFQNLIFGFEINIKFIITTKDQLIINKLNKSHSYEIISLDGFNSKKSLEYIKIKLDEDSIHKNSLNENDWKELLEIMSLKTDGKILPIHLNKLLTKLNEDGQFWKLNEIGNYLKNEIKTKFNDLKVQNNNAYKILCYLAFLNEESISKYLIYQLVQDKIDSDLIIIGIDYLTRNSEINKSENGYFTIHETTQIEILHALEFEEDIYLNKIIEILDNLIVWKNIIENQKTLNSDYKEYFNHSIKVLSLDWKSKKKNKTINNLLDKTAYIYKNILIKYDKALENYIESLRIRKKSLPKDHPDIATSSSFSQLIFNTFGYFFAPILTGIIMDTFEDKVEGFKWGYINII